LNCKHCRAAARQEAYSGELTFAECCALLDNIASFSRPTIILTGGEPMLRADIYEIAGYAHGLGLPVVMAPCGPLLNNESVAKILRAGIRRISLSLDGATAASHDEFRGIPGAFESVLRGIEAARRGGLEFQINTTVSRHNLAELPAILDLAVRLRAALFNPFLLVPTGRGSELRDQELSSEQYEQALQWLAAQAKRPEMPIRVTCAPHYQRILRQTHGAASPAPGAPGGPIGHAQGRPELSRMGGCLGGKAFAFVSHQGKVQICGFLELEAGDLRRENFDFAKIWRTSPLFAAVRDVDSYRGRCGCCEFRKLCGGCRARAYAVTGDYLAEEPFCAHRPHALKQVRAKLDPLDQKILAAIQADFPLVERPFEAVAARLGVGEEDLIARVRRMRSEGFIRRLGAVFDTRRLGYVSTLVAARIPPGRLAEVAAAVSELPSVTHNYGRRHSYNLWFTLTAESEGEIERTLADLRARTGIGEFHSLPAMAMYKVQATFRAGDERPSSLAPRAETGTDAVTLTEEQKRLAWLAGDFPVAQAPFAERASQAGVSGHDLLEQIRAWRAAGVIRRFGAVVAHRSLGYRANGMAVFQVPEERADAAGRRLAEFEEISHCYRRPRLPDWPYDLFAMVHGRSEAEVRAFVERAACELGLQNYDILFSTAEYKKKSFEYFAEAPRVLPEGQKR
jgi:radical SAM protein with 4Fe4S-binding SPASM domain